MKNTNAVEVQILNAFTDYDKGGNPAGVVFNAGKLTNQQKLKLAKNVGLSETAFVSNSSVADFKLDFFTPSRQIAHCGHATIATFSYLSQKGFIKNKFSSKETIDGRREILINNDLAFMEQTAPSYIDVRRYKQTILNSLGLHEDDLLNNAPINVVNTGNSFAVIAVTDNDVLQNIKPDFDLITQVSEQFDLIGYYVFSLQTDDASRDANTRMFAPRHGIDEEAATGMAAGPLACYLYDVLNMKKDRFLIQQGWFMKPASPSLIIVDLILNNGKITKLMAGGKGIFMRSVKIKI